MTTGVGTDFKGMCIQLRQKVKENTEHLKAQIEVTKKATLYPPESNQGEMIANLTLAYRCLEDSAMRLGKAIQAYDGGISIYDKDMPERDLNKEA